jgi:hypothetical protein
METPRVVREITALPLDSSGRYGAIPKSDSALRDHPRVTTLEQPTSAKNEVRKNLNL